MDTERHEELITATIEILTIVKGKIVDTSDVAMTRFNSVAEFRFLLDTYLYQVKHGDINVFQSLSSEFAPTGSFQEHAMANGWSREFLVLAKRFDHISKAIWE